MTAVTSVALAACNFVNSQVLCLRLTPSLDTGQLLSQGCAHHLHSKSFIQHWHRYRSVQWSCRHTS